MDSLPPATPRAGAMGIARRVMRAAASDRISLTAAGCAFYAMLALFPAIFLLVLLYGLVFDRATVEPQLEVLRELVPEETFDLIAARLHELVEQPRPRLEWGAIVSGGVAIWSASAGTRAMLGALNMAHGVEESRNFFLYHLLAIGMTLSITIAATLAIAALVALPGVAALFSLPAPQALTLRAMSLGTLLGLVFIGLVVVYRLGPSGRHPGLLWTLPGAVVATLLWAVASAGFTLYVSNFATYDLMYGPLGAVVALLMWFWVSVYVVLLGAELNVALMVAHASTPR
ncbi:YihY/virulence factor BrkB family protein [Neoroseomonas rubea]|uniref:YihY/virulence factor BrkB family protein n=1 Tax=Neoroseomonas rubea TaxID=2748666 RepID=UPI0018DFF90A|nr:YihY/virulence factor BrkB family protein [Roseomonas rubea]